MISGYRCALYDSMLRHWYRTDFPRMDRGGTWALESLWLNFDPPARLHDFQYLGGDFRERERIKRKQQRWRARLANLAPSEQLAMLEELQRILSPDTARAAAAPLADSGDGGSSVESGDVAGASRGSSDREL